MLVSPKLPLSLERIALLWADERKEPNISEIVRPLLTAFVKGDIKPAREQDSNWLNEEPMSSYLGDLYKGLPYQPEPTHVEELVQWTENWGGFTRDPDWYHISGYHGDLDNDPVGELLGRPTRAVVNILEYLLEMEATRDGFLHWAQEQGYPRPNSGTHRLPRRR
jgi:hypothetical protein